MKSIVFFLSTYGLLSCLLSLHIFPLDEESIVLDALGDFAIEFVQFERINST